VEEPVGGLETSADTLVSPFAPKLILFSDVFAGIVRPGHFLSSGFQEGDISLFASSNNIGPDLLNFFFGVIHIALAQVQMASKSGFGSKFFFTKLTLHTDFYFGHVMLGKTSSMYWSCFAIFSPYIV
ncbi:hypothetical protein DND47_30765, partial [Pseudomonas syringae pv. syringae]